MSSWYSKKQKMRNLLDNPPESVEILEECNISCTGVVPEERWIYPEQEVTETTESIERSVMLNPEKFGDTPGKLIQFDLEAEEQGGMNHHPMTEEDQASDLNKLNKEHTIEIMALLSLGSVAVGYSVFYTSEVFSLLQTKYEWNDEEAVRNYDIVSGALLFGASIGALLAPKLLQEGRRKALMTACCIGALGTVMTLI